MTSYKGFGYWEMAAVYKIVNKINGREYIGATSQLCNRVIIHFLLLKKNTHYNKLLQSDYNMFGKSAFTVTLIKQRGYHFYAYGCSGGYWRDVMRRLETKLIIKEQPAYNTHHVTERITKEISITIQTKQILDSI